MVIYVVAPGDSLYSISRRYGVPTAKIIRDNELNNPNRLVIGQTLVLLTDEVTYTVRRGDTIYSIARMYGISVYDLLTANPQVQNPSIINPGLLLSIPVTINEDLGNLAVNGYAFPNINMGVLWKTYGPPMAVAPINEVEKVIQYAVTAIPRDKILMGIPNYGYEWILPYEEGTAATTVTNVGAVDLAARVGANIMFDEVSQAPFFNYYGSDGRQRVVWFEDARSIFAKLMLAGEYELEGVSYWTIGSFFPQNWLVLESLYDVVKML